MPMMMGAWVAQTIAAVTGLGVPERLHAHGPLTARRLTAEHGVEARPEFLERASAPARAWASSPSPPTAASAPRRSPRR
jgi:hypothetical protein